MKFKYRAHLGAVAAIVLGGALLTPGAALGALAPGAGWGVGPTSGGSEFSDDGIGARFVNTSGGATGGIQVAMDVDYDLWVWGPNDHGQLGNGTTVASSEPIRVEAFAGREASTIDAGTDHTVALLDGVVWAWGSNEYGQLGTEEPGDKWNPTPVKMPEGVSFVNVSAGERHTVALDADWNVWAWGSNEDGQLGTGLPDGSPVPVQVKMPSGLPEHPGFPGEGVGRGFSAVDAGGRFTVALDFAGKAWTWGARSGESGVTTDLEPVQVVMPASSTRFDEISAGQSHVVALTENGLAYAWGENSGRLGDSGDLNRKDPVAVVMPGGVTFASVSAGSEQSVALDSDGNAYVWVLAGAGVPTRYDGAPSDERWGGKIPFERVSAGSDYRVFAVGMNGNTYTWNSALSPSSDPARSISDVRITGVSFGGVPGTNLTQFTTEPGDRLGGVSWTVDTPQQGFGPVPVVVAWEQFGVWHEDLRGEFIFLNVDHPGAGMGDGRAVAPPTTVSESVTISRDETISIASAEGVFKPGETVSVTMFSDPIALGELSADPETGTVTGDVTIPAEAPDGVHHMLLQGESSYYWAQQEFILSSDDSSGPGGDGGSANKGNSVDNGKSAGGDEVGVGSGPAAGDNVAGVTAGKGLANEFWLAETGGGALLPIGAAVATLALLAGGILLVARKRRQAPEPSDG